MRVLVIPEDFTKDQYMLKPIIEAMLEKVGRSNVIVRVCQDPRFHGVSEVMDWALLSVGPVGPAGGASSWRVKVIVDQVQSTPVPVVTSSKSSMNGL